MAEPDGDDGPEDNDREADDGDGESDDGDSGQEGDCGPKMAIARRNVAKALLSRDRQEAVLR